LELSSHGLPRVSGQEGQAISSDFLGRMMSYLDIHWQELSTVTSETLEIMKSTSAYPVPTYPSNFHQPSNILNSIYESFAKTMIPAMQQSDVCFDASSLSSRYFTWPKVSKTLSLSDSSSLLFTSTTSPSATRPHHAANGVIMNENNLSLREERAAVRIQLWLRAYRVVRQVMVQEERAPVEYYDMSAYLGGYYRSLSRSQYRSIHVYHQLYTLLAISALKRKYVVKCELRHGTAIFMRDLIEDCVNDAVDRSFRTSLAIRNALIQQQQQQLLAMPRMVDSQGNPITNNTTSSNASKSLSARFLKATGASNALTFFKINSTEDEGMESGEYDESASSKQRTSSSATTGSSSSSSSISSTYSSFMKSFGRSK
jgi:hypothetical protein